MKRKRPSILLLLLAFIILIGIFLVIMISTNERLEKSEPAIYASLEDFKTKKLTQAYKTMLTKVDRKVQLEIDEQELNDLVAIIIQDYENSTIAISGYSSQIAADCISIRLDSKLLNLIPTQFVIKIKPSVEENKIRLLVTEFKVGKLPISPRFILKQLTAPSKGGYHIDAQQQSVVLENKYQEQIILNDITLEQGTAIMNIELSIQNVKDLMNLFEKLLPEGLKGLIE